MNYAPYCFRCLVNKAEPGSDYCESCRKKTKRPQPALVLIDLRNVGCP